MDPSSVYPGMRRSYDGNLCTVRWCGQVAGTKGSWLGVEWDDISRGKHSGEHEGVRYFTCASKSPTAASFIRPTRAHDAPQSFLQALRGKYAEGIDSVSHLPSVSNEPVTYISGKVAEEVGFDKIRQQLANLKGLRIVLVDSLTVHRPEVRDEDNKTEALSRDVEEVCPRITELNVSRNLFETWNEIVDIVRQLKSLTTLRADGLRLRSVDSNLPSGALATAPFTRITSLTLDDTLMPWPDVAKIASSMPALSSLSASGNEYTMLPKTKDTLPHTLKDLKLERNNFTSLSAIVPVTITLPNLENLILKSNHLSTVSTTTTTDVVSSSLVRVDVADNDINSFSFVDLLPDAFPKLTSLRISRNRLFENLFSAVDKRPLSADDGFMFTTARLANLKVLNYSNITDKERLDAEVYYLGQIAAEVNSATVEQHPHVLSRHRRFSELCEIYGNPLTRQATSPKPDIDKHSLAAGLCLCTFSVEKALARDLDCPSSLKLEIPKSLSVFGILGVIGRTLNLKHPMLLELVWETGEVELSHANGSDVDTLGIMREEVASSSKDRGDNKLREEVLVPRTRRLSSWVEDRIANIRIQRSEIDFQRRKNK